MIASLVVALSLRVSAAQPPKPSRPAVTADTLESLLRQDAQPLSGEFEVKVPQEDLRATLDGFPLVPAMGATTWIDFQPEGKTARATGELVLLEDEVGPVQRAALEAGFSITAVHDHFLGERPRLAFMHVSARGPLGTLQDRAKRLLSAATRAREGKGLQAGPTTAPGSLDALALQKILGGRPSTDDNVVKFKIDRPDEPRDPGAPTWLAFEGAMEKAAASGVIAVRAGEVDGVTRALDSGGLEVTALNGRALEPAPALYELRFWGVGRAEDLARALKAALERTGPDARP